MSQSNSDTSNSGAGAENNRDSIHQRAYHLWQESGRPHGRDEEFWLKAEKDILGGGTAQIPGTGAVSSQQLKESTDANHALENAKPRRKSR